MTTRPASAGQTALSFVLLVGAVVVFVGVTLAILSFGLAGSQGRTASGNRAYAAVLSGTNDALLRLARDPSFRGTYSLVVGNDTVSVEVIATTTQPLTPCGATQWYANYYANYDGNMSPIDPPTVSRCEDAPPDYAWGSASPAPGIPGNSGFVARWIGTPLFATGSTTFSVSTDDGERLFVDGGQAITANWSPHTGTTEKAVKYLTGGTHTVILDYYNSNGSTAYAHLSWTSGGTSTAYANPRITSFTASPGTINLGSSTALSWTTAGVANCESLHPADWAGDWIGASGNTTVTPARTQAYTMQCWNSAFTKFIYGETPVFTVVQLLSPGQAQITATAQVNGAQSSLRTVVQTAAPDATVNVVTADFPAQ